jgi:hypothetical protein
MMIPNRPFIQEWAGFQEAYDLLIVTLGFENRATAVAQKNEVHALRKVAIGYTTDHVINYQANKDWYASHGFEVVEPAEEEFEKLITSMVRTVVPQKEVMRICIDISSMTRSRLARLVQFFWTGDSDQRTEVDFVYILAEYSPPPPSLSRNTHVGPVTPQFSGWWIEPDLPVTAVVGLGYEEDKAIGAIEHIQPSDIWLFFPESPEPGYTSALQKANASLIEARNAPRVLKYQVAQPLLTLSYLESLCSGLLQKSNIVLLPFGPKIFVLSSLIVAKLYEPRIAVWRVSGSEAIVDRKASDHIYGLRLIVN